MGYFQCNISIINIIKCFLKSVAFNLRRDDGLKKKLEGKQKVEYAWKPQGSSHPYKHTSINKQQDVYLRAFQILFIFPFFFVGVGVYEF